jgi:hypothetical protein
MLSVKRIVSRGVGTFKGFPNAKQGFLLEKHMIIRTSSQKAVHTLYHLQKWPIHEMARTEEYEMYVSTIGEGIVTNGRHR